MLEQINEAKKSVEGKKALGPEADDHVEPDNKKEVENIRKEAEIVAAEA